MSSIFDVINKTQERKSATNLKKDLCPYLVTVLAINHCDIGLKSQYEISAKQGCHFRALLNLLLWFA